MKLLSVEGLSKQFAGRLLFEGINLHVDAGEIVCLMGPSGAGKTTLLRCCNGLERADGGIVRVREAQLRAGDGAVAFQMSAQAMRRKVGFVFQGWHLFSHRTVLQNVIEAPVFVRGETVAAASTRAMELLDHMGIGHRAAALPHQLSGGEQQRAAVARALAMQPELLLVDEPTSALDDERTESLAQLLRGLAADGLAILSVTHDSRFARALAARVLLLKDGHVSEGAAGATSA